ADGDHDGVIDNDDYNIWHDNYVPPPPQPDPGPQPNVIDINSITASSTGGLEVDVNGVVFFVANDGSHGAGLGKSDGTSAGTVLVKDIFAGPSDSNPYDLTNVGGTLFFTTYSGTGSGNTLWKSDGTDAGTVALNTSADATKLENVAGTLYFRAYDSTY